MTVAELNLCHALAMLSEVADNFKADARLDDLESGDFVALTTSEVHRFGAFALHGPPLKVSRRDLARLWSERERLMFVAGAALEVLEALERRGLPPIHSATADDLGRAAHVLRAAMAGSIGLVPGQMAEGLGGTLGPLRVLP